MDVNATNRSSEILPLDTPSEKSIGRRVSTPGIPLGTLAVGSDADITLWDAGRVDTIRQENLNHGSDYTPYEGIEITGWPVRTILRGDTIALNGKVVSEGKKGRYQHRQVSEVFDGVRDVD